MTRKMSFTKAEVAAIAVAARENNTEITAMVNGVTITAKPMFQCSNPEIGAPVASADSEWAQ